MGLFDDVDFRDHPDTIQIRVAGQEVPWFLGRKSFRIAREEHGVEVADILEGAQEAHDDADVSGAVENVASLVWVGLLVFDPDLKQQEVADLISIQEVGRLQETIENEFDKVQEEGEVGKAPKTAAS